VDERTDGQPETGVGMTLLICICFNETFLELPIPVAVRSKTWVCGLSFTGIVGSNPTGDMDVCLL
jgi:hypothetical protein